MLPGILTSVDTCCSPHTVGLVYIDADTDLSTPATSSTGTFAGMNMCHLLQTEGALESMREFSRRGGKALCDANNTVFFGTNMALEGNTHEHFAYLFEHGFKVVPSSSVPKDPVGNATEAFKYLEDQMDIILVHLDVDSIDTGTFPLANVPNYTRVQFEAMLQALGVFVASNKVGGLCIAEVNPDHDPGLKMVRKLTEAIVKMLGERVQK
jgi:arginase